MGALADFRREPTPRVNGERTMGIVTKDVPAHVAMPYQLGVRDPWPKGSLWKRYNPSISSPELPLHEADEFMSRDGQVIVPARPGDVVSAFLVRHPRVVLVLVRTFCEQGRERGQPVRRRWARLELRDQSCKEEADQ